METSELPTAKPNAWQPETDTLRLAVLGKLLEEIGEGGQVAARCIIQGIDEKIPRGAKTNREWLQDELSDLMAVCILARDYLGLDNDQMNRRYEMKRRFLSQWFDTVSEDQLESAA